MARIAVLDDYQGVACRMTDWGRLGADSEVVFFSDHLDAQDALVERLSGFDVVVAMRERTRFPAALLERLADLRLLVTTGVVNAAIDLEAAAARGVVVCGTRPGPRATAELTFGLILACCRHIAEEDAALRRGAWQTRIGTTLEGKRLGVLGLGNLGSRVATIGAAFGMEVVAWSANLTDERAAACGARRVGLDELLSGADVVTVHLVASRRTRGLLGAAELAWMRPGAILVNTSRAPIVDEDALADALETGAIAGAGLDVFGTEPLPAHHRLLAAPNTVLTPHVGYVTEETYRVYFADAVEDVLAFLAGRPIRVLAPR